MPSPITVIRTGTGWTADVTSLQLSTSLTDKDFLIVTPSVIISNSDVTKTTATLLTYTGTALSTNTQVRIYRLGNRDIDLLQFGEVTSQLGMNQRLTQIETRLDDMYEMFVGYNPLVASPSAAIAAHVAEPDPHTQYLLETAATSTYLTISGAASTYLPSASAASTYLTIANAASTYRPLASGLPAADLTGTIDLARLPSTVATDAEVAASVANYVPLTQRGAANGVATLDGTTKVPSAQSRPSNVVYNASTATWTFTWADGSQQTIDTPLETVFQSFNYSSVTKQVTVTLVNGSTTTMDLNDLVDLPEIQVATQNPVAAPTTGQRVYVRSDTGEYWVSNGTSWVGPYLNITAAERSKLAAIQANAINQSTADARYQPLDTDLTAVAGLTTTGLVERTGAGTAATQSITTLGRALVSSANEAAARAAIGTNVGVAIPGNVVTIPLALVPESQRVNQAGDDVWRSLTYTSYTGWRTLRDQYPGLAGKTFSNWYLLILGVNQVIPDDAGYESASWWNTLSNPYLGKMQYRIQYDWSGGIGNPTFGAAQRYKEYWGTATDGSSAAIVPITIPDPEFNGSAEYWSIQMRALRKYPALNGDPRWSVYGMFLLGVIA